MLRMIPMGPLIHPNQKRLTIAYHVQVYCGKIQKTKSHFLTMEDGPAPQSKKILIALSLRPSYPKAVCMICLCSEV